MFEKLLEEDVAKMTDGAGEGGKEDASAVLTRMESSRGGWSRCGSGH